MKQVRRYFKDNQKKDEPFTKWFNNLDVTLKAKVLAQVRKLQLGNYTDCSILKATGGLREARVRSHSGIRIYFSEVDNTIIILLAGGDKCSQTKDIRLATEYLNDYKQRRS